MAEPKFDEAMARRSDRALPDASIAALVAMPPEEWPSFVRMFNDAFRWARPGEPVRRIVEEHPDA